LLVDSAVRSEREIVKRTSFEKSGNVLGPFSPEPVSSSQTSVSSADYESVDTVSDQVEGSGATTFDLSELGAASSTDERSSNAGVSSYVVPSDL
jgi:hypothetical protein